MTTAKDILALAQAEIGIKESPPNSNNVKYNTAYYGGQVNDTRLDWCAVFLWWLFREGDSRALYYGGNKTASCPTLLRYYQSNGQEVKDYQPGDLIFFHFSATRNADHVGICESWDGAYITTIDGNTGTTSEANGGAVMRRRRAKSYILAGIRPDYQTETEEKDMTKEEVIEILEEYLLAEAAKAATAQPDPWSAEARTWAEEDQILLGDQTGARQYKVPATREMLVVTLYRLWRRVKEYIDEKLG